VASPKMSVPMLRLAPRFTVRFAAMSSVLKSAMASTPSAMLPPDQLAEFVHTEFEVALVQVPLVRARRGVLKVATTMPRPPKKAFFMRVTWGKPRHPWPGRCRKAKGWEPSQDRDRQKGFPSVGSAWDEDQIITQSRKSATKSLVGFSRSWAGEPTCWMLPSCRMTTRSASSKASS